MTSNQNDTLLNFFEDSIMLFNLPFILTLNNELYIDQELLLVQGTDMKIVEVIEISQSDDAIHLVVKNQYKDETIELSHPTNDIPDPIKWMVVSIPYIVTKVIEKMKG